MSKRKQFAVIGLGRFGKSIVTTLVEHNCDVMCCDIKLEVVNEMSKIADHVVQVDIMDPHAVDALGLNNFDVVIVSIGENLEASIMATLLAKEKGCPLVIAKAKNDIQRSILEKVGADRVVLPERDMGMRIATNLVTTNVIDYINLSDEFAIAELEPKKNWIDKSLQKSNIRAEYGLNIVAIKRDKKIIVSPGPNEIILEDDVLVAVGESKSMKNYINK